MKWICDKKKKLGLKIVQPYEKWQTCTKNQNNNLKICASSYTMKVRKRLRKFQEKERMRHTYGFDERNCEKV